MLHRGSNGEIAVQLLGSDWRILQYVHEAVRGDSLAARQVLIALGSGPNLPHVCVSVFLGSFWMNSDYWCIVCPVNTYHSEQPGE